MANKNSIVIVITPNLTIRQIRNRALDVLAVAYSETEYVIIKEAIVTAVTEKQLIDRIRRYGTIIKG